MVSDAFFDAAPHRATTQRMSGKKLAEGPLPEEAGDVFSVKASAQVLQGALQFPEHLPALAMAPLDVNLPVPELQAAVRRVCAHSEVGEEPCGSSTAEESVDL